MKRSLLAMTLAALATAVGPAWSETPAKKDQKSEPSKPMMKQAYLGVAVAPMPPALAVQMRGVIPSGQGILVSQVAKDSPAAKAGLQPYDVLLTYGDQKLSSPEQLVNMTHADKPGHEITLSFVRNGKVESCKATLGERAAPALEPSAKVGVLPKERLREFFAEIESRNDGRAWESFDALKLTRIDAQHWRAEVEYRNDQGKTEHKKFEGTREQLRKDIQAEKDLPASERSHLLRALNLQEPIFDLQFPPLDKLVPDAFQQP